MGARRAIAQVTVLLVVLVVAIAGAFLFLRGDDGDGPADAAEAFADAWSAGDGDALRALVVDPAAIDALDPVAVTDGLGTTERRITLVDGTVTEDDGTATVDVGADLTLGPVGQVRWETQLRLVEDEERGWLVDWTPAALHPALPAEGGTLRRTVTWPERAPILGVDDTPVRGPIDTVVVGAVPGRLQDRAATTAALQEQLGVDPAAFDAAVGASHVQPDHFVPIIEVPRATYDAVRDVIYPIPGLQFREQVGRGPADRARHVAGRFGEVTAERLEALGPPYAVGDEVGLDGIEARFEEQLAGRPTVAIEAVDGAGTVVEAVGSFPGSAPAPVRTTLDPRIQAAADAALADLPVPAALVAVDAATGQVRATASSPTSDAFDRAIGGAYPPGSTFKVVTAYALLANGVVTSDTTVDCSPTRTVDGRPFRNFEGGAAGPEPFRQAFAESCNTAIIDAAEDLPAGALATAAEVFGFNLDYDLGPTSVGGSFPDTTTPVEAAASAIGQAAVTASPLHMATVAAAVLDGTWRTPVLLPGLESAEQVVRPLDPAVAETLRTLMRAVVTEGSGTAADVAGLDVIGKSGTAEFGAGDPPPTHAWFIAAANGLGIAVVLEDGGVGGRDAAPVVAQFLEALGA